MTTEIGLSFRSEYDPARRRAIAETVARFDFDTLGVWDDLGDPPPWRMLGDFVGQPGRARIGPECLALPKYAALDGVAGELLLLEQQRPVRVFVGLTGGAWLDEIGLKRARPSQMREAVAALDYLLAGETSGFEGKHYRVNPGFRLSLPSVPIQLRTLIGAWGPAMAAVAGEVADELKVGGTANPSMASLARERVTPGASRAGRPGSEPLIVLGAVTVVDEDGRAAMELARLRAAPYIAVIGGNDPTVVRDYPEELSAIQRHVRAGETDLALKHLPDDLLRRFAFCGTPAEVIRQAEAAFEAGATRVEFGSPHGLDQLHGIELIGSRILPAFRG